MGRYPNLPRLGFPYGGRGGSSVDELCSARGQLHRERFEKQVVRRGRSALLTSRRLALWSVPSRALPSSQKSGGRDRFHFAGGREERMHVGASTYRCMLLALLKPCTQRW